MEPGLLDREDSVAMSYISMRDGASMEPGLLDREDSSLILPLIACEFTPLFDRCCPDRISEHGGRGSQPEESPQFRRFERSPGIWPALERSLNNLGPLRRQHCTPAHEGEAILANLTQVHNNH